MSIFSARNGDGAFTSGASAQLVPANPDRVGLIISNFATGGTPGPINLTFQEGTGTTPTATAANGIQLASGSSLVLLGDTNFTGRINCFGAGALGGWVEF